jgi:multiple sugar transport system permease protein
VANLSIPDFAADSADFDHPRHVLTWSDSMWPLVALLDSDLRTLPIAFAVLAGEHVQDTYLMMAGSLLTVLPVPVLFVAVQRYYVAGITAEGLKE